MRVRVEGLREIQAALQELPKATAKNVMKRALTEVAEPIAETARRHAPVKSGFLRDSIAISTRSTGGDAGKRAFAQAMASGATRQQAGQAARAANRGKSSQVELFIGPKREGTFYAHFQEFGTRHAAPRPFMRPAWDAIRPQILSVLAKIMWRHIERAVARRAKKLAKAKGK